MIYLDSCLIIYLVERHAYWGDLVARMLLTDEIDFAISPLVECECLVGPIRRNDRVLQQSYSAVFARFVLLEMPEEIYLHAAELRAHFGVKVADALHLACALHHRCNALYTNDGRLTRASHGFARNLVTDPL
jgi:uncharacterized protein